MNLTPLHRQFGIWPVADDTPAPAPLDIGVDPWSPHPDTGVPTRAASLAILVPHDGWSVRGPWATAMYEPLRACMEARRARRELLGVAVPAALKRRRMLSHTKVQSTYVDDEWALERDVAIHVPAPERVGYERAAELFEGCHRMTLAVREASVEVTPAEDGRADLAFAGETRQVAVVGRGELALTGSGHVDVARSSVCGVLTRYGGTAVRSHRFVFGNATLEDVLTGPFGRRIRAAL